MFTVAILADLHLPDAADTVKETVLDWALAEAKAQKVDLIVGAGDLTGTGTEAAAMRIRSAARCISRSSTSVLSVR